jgi:hypothetical protein
MISSMRPQPQFATQDGARQLEGPVTDVIRDAMFMRELNNLRALCEFIRREQVDIRPDQAILLSFEKLARLRLAEPRLWRSTRGGRDARPEEWDLVEERTQALFNLLTEAQRRRYYLTKSENIIVRIPSASVPLAVLVLVGEVFYPEASFPLYVIWLCLLGALGSIAFIAMNALSQQKDLTFDLTNKRLMNLRVVLGALFGLVLAVPFGFGAFVKFGSDVRSIAALPGSMLDTDTLRQAVLLLLPFVLGFGTSLVLSFLNRIAEAIDVILGRRAVANP